MGGFVSRSLWLSGHKAVARIRKRVGGVEDDGGLVPNGGPEGVVAAGNHNEVVLGHHHWRAIDESNSPSTGTADTSGS